MEKTRLLKKIGSWPLGSLWVFGVKQAWAALFGGLMLLAVIVTAYFHLPWLSRYDWLFVAAISIQAFMLLTKLEKPHEIITIAAFHLTGLGMELFKTSSAIASWAYPGHAIFHLGNVPLFSGFMYAAVGSYLARAWRVFELSFTRYPNRLATAFLALAIYCNFFTHHYIMDLRHLLFLVVIILFGRTTVYYTVNRRRHHMPLIVAFLLIAFFIWIAENIGTRTKAWLYPDQVANWHLVSMNKLGSWFLLMIISFIMVDLLHYLRAGKKHADRSWDV